MKIARDFILDPSLVLYLPLYELDGASFMSEDAYGHLCTATGALWTPQGRSFDGGDDRIDVGTTPIPLITSAGTIIAWVKTTTDSAGAVFSVGDTDVSNAFYLAVGDGVTGTLDDELITIYRNTGGTVDNRIGYTTLTRTELFDGNWHQIAITGDTVYKIYLDGASKAVSVGYGANNGDWTDVTTADNATIGTSRDDSQTRNFYTGDMGEVWVYNRALSALEIQHVHLATKWRYR